LKNGYIIGDEKTLKMKSESDSSVLWNITKAINEASEQDLASSATLTIFRDEPKLMVDIVSLLDSLIKRKEAILDLGVGYGFMTCLLKQALGFEKAYGVDIDEERARIARGRGINVYCLDLESNPLPFPNECFDFVMSLGLLNHLKFFDNVISEVTRVLRHGGIFFISIPNLGWWINRLCLLLGFQPPEIEISKKYAVGLPKFYPRQESIEYVHSPTLRGIRELLTLYGFQVTKVFGAKIPHSYMDAKIPSTHKRKKLLKSLVKAIDFVLSKRTGLSVRLFLISQKGGS